jgi:FkbM family methyltransferase
MIDVGAHHGSALMWFLDAGWNIYAFEPDDKNRAKLESRLREHPQGSRVNVDPRCVSKESRSLVPFFVSEKSSGISGLSSFHESHRKAKRVDVTTLREFLESREIQDVDFLKIDAEGHDLFVLEGLPWDRILPRVIECEFEDAKTVSLGYRFPDLADFLLKKGYSVFVSEWHPIIEYGARHDWHQLARYPCSLENPNGWGNLLAFRDPLNEAELLDAVWTVLKANGGQCARAPKTALASDKRTSRVSLRRANELVRLRRFDEALQMYLDLYAENSLSIYENNALWAARKTGFSAATSVNDFARGSDGRWRPSGVKQ